MLCACLSCISDDYPASPHNTANPEKDLNEVDTFVNHRSVDLRANGIPHHSVPNGVAL